MPALGLNEYHYQSIINFMKFSKYRRNQHLRSVDRCTSDVKETRLSEQMYTQEEVADLIDGLHDLLRAELESELINATHTNILLLQQMFEQAEHWHLKLQVDISQLENKELLEKIKEFEDKELCGQSDFKNPPSPLKMKLEPISQTEGPVVLLHNEIDKLRDENNKLRQRLAQVEKQASSYLRDKNKMSEEIVKTKHMAASASQNKSFDQDMNDEIISAMQQKVNQVQEEIQQTLKMSSDNQRDLQGDLTSTKHRLLEVQSQLEMAEKELEKKFSQTTTYLNIKKMLVTKNDQLKELRQRLAKHEDISPVD